jgi:hypothetical protein
MATVVPCGLSRMFRRPMRPPPRQAVTPHFQHPRVEVGSPREYEFWNERARAYLREAGRSPRSLERTDATINYAQNRVILFNLPDPQDELSIGETLAHEVLHSFLEQTGERYAARTLDAVAKGVGDSRRTGGL